MTLFKNIKQLQRERHTLVERLLSVFLVLASVVYIIASLHSKSGNASAGIAALASFCFIASFSALGWVQNWVYYTAEDKKRPLDERQYKQRLRIYYRSFFIVAVLFGLSIIAIMTNTLGIRDLLGSTDSSFLGAAMIWICYAIPSILGAWTKTK